MEKEELKEKKKVETMSEIERKKVYDEDAELDANFLKICIEFTK